MAPWPEQGSEPKAPDKDDNRESIEVNTRVEAEADELPENTNCARIEQKSEDKDVSGLNDGQLRALLDEAFSYKCPKDREGKSELFKELLQEVEADETDSKVLGGSLKLPRSHYNLPVRRRQSRHSGPSRECGVGVSTTRGGSLQNLHALGMEGGRRSRRRDTLVSARQREGGSLPTNVNVDNDHDLDIICQNYTSRATLEVSEPKKEEKMESEESTVPPLLKVQGLVPNGTETLNTKEEESRDVDNAFASSINVGPVESAAMLYPSTPVQHVSVLSIPPGQLSAASDDHRISDISEVKKLNVSRSRPQKKGQVSEESDNNGGELLGLPLTAYWNRYSSFTLLDFQDSNTRLAFGNPTDPKPKPVDENGNALSCVRVDSNCLERKKQRRVKAKNDRNTILINMKEIEGFRGEADIETLMEYIESPSLDANKSSKARPNQTTSARNSVKVRAKEDEPRSTRKRKEKFQRCNSLEEISKTKLEDLTEESSSERVISSTPLPKKFGTVDDAKVGKKSSWKDTEPIPNEQKPERQSEITSDIMQESEFHVVTKKQRRKKRRTGSSRGVVKQDYYGGRESGSNRLIYQYRNEQGTSQPRRKSASSVPPSDKSDSSDLDSVHSLPVSSSSARQRVRQNSASGGSTPQASYADIAKSAASPPHVTDCQESCLTNSSFTDSDVTTHKHNSTLPSPPASLKKDAMTDTCDTSIMLTSEEYPPLDNRTVDICTVKCSSGAKDNVPLKPQRTPPVIVVESGVMPKSLTCDIRYESSSVKRPPVVLMNDPSRGDSQVPEIKFGFDVNYQLLSDDQCNTRVESPPEAEVVPESPANTTTSASAVPEPQVQGCYQHVSDPNLVQYLSNSWYEVVLKMEAGEAVYYNGQ